MFVHWTYNIKLCLCLIKYLAIKAYLASVLDEGLASSSGRIISKKNSQVPYG